MLRRLDERGVSGKTLAMIESVRDTLNRIERELLAKIEDIKAELSPLEHELLDVQRAVAALDAPIKSSPKTTTNTGVEAERAHWNSPYRQLTMKELTMKALTERYKNGATASTLLEYFRDAYKRDDIARPSFSPQLSRLKADGVLTLKGKIWNLAERDEEGPDTSVSEPSENTGEGDTSPFESRKSFFD